MKFLQFLLITTLTLLISCDSEISSELKGAFFQDVYLVGDTVNFKYAINEQAIDTISLTVSENEIYDGEEYGVGGYKYQEYNFAAQSRDKLNTIDLIYWSDGNSFYSNIKLDTISFTLDIIEKKISSTIINGVQYEDIFLVKSESKMHTHAYISNTYGIIQIVNDSIELTPLK